jgi:hypothetical protein
MPITLAPFIITILYESFLRWLKRGYSMMHYMHHTHIFDQLYLLEKMKKWLEIICKKL